MPPRKLREPIHDIMSEIAARMNELIHPGAASRAISRTTDTGREVSRYGSYTPEGGRRISSIEGNNEYVNIPLEEFYDRVLELQTPGGRVVDIHTHPPGYEPVPSHGDAGYYRPYLSDRLNVANGDAREFRDNDSMLGILGTGSNTGAYGLNIVGRLPRGLTNLASLNSFARTANPDYLNEFRRRLFNSDPVGKELSNHPIALDLERIGVLDGMMEHMDFARRFPNTVNVGLRTSNPDIQNYFNRLYDRMVNGNDYAEGGLVENDDGTVTYRGRRDMAYNHPLARRSLNEAHQVNPRFAERRLAEEIERTENSPEPGNFESLVPSWHSIGTEAIGMIPGGETGMYAFGREGAAPSLSHALSRDAVNAATWPMGFLKAIGIGTVSDVLSDGIIDALQGKTAQAQRFRAARDRGIGPRGQIPERTRRSIIDYLRENEDD